MVTLTVTLTNEEATAAEASLTRIEGVLAKKLQREHARADDNSACAYNALRKFAQPLRAHLRKIGR